MKITIGKKNIIAIIFIIFIIIVFCVKINKIEVLGTIKYSKEEVVNKIFSNNFDKISIVAFVKNKFFSHKVLPYIEKYDIKFLSPFAIQLIVYEKPIIGSVVYMSSYFYFDKDGIVCGSSNKKSDKVPEIIGLNFKNIVLNKKLPIENEDIFRSILNITNNINNFHLPISTIKYESINDIIIYIGKIEVLLGDNTNMEFKLITLKDIYPKISKFRGILDLKNAKEGMLDEKYIFKKLE